MCCGRWKWKWAPGCVRLSGTCTAPHLGQHLTPTPDPTFVFPIRKYNLRLASHKDRKLDNCPSSTCTQRALRPYIVHGSYLSRRNHPSETTTMTSLECCLVAGCVTPLLPGRG